MSTEFKCKVCGADCILAPADGSGAVCPEHCPDHQYLYGDGHYCGTCGQEPPFDWYDVEDGQ